MLRRDIGSYSPHLSLCAVMCGIKCTFASDLTITTVAVLLIWASCVENIVITVCVYP